MTTTESLLQFWAKAIPSLQVHPDDVAALDDKRHKHKLARDVLVGPWMGPLRSAPVVLLTLNGKLAGVGVEQREATIPSAREEMARNLLGDAPLPDWRFNRGGREWTEGHFPQFGITYESAAPKVAFINLIAYRSAEGGKDMRMADRLASSRIVRAWARDTLFPEAEAGERVVVCLCQARGCDAWGLDYGTKRGQTLFAPHVTRRGHIFLDERGEIGIAVRRAMGLLP
jgi:hypothetical protein